MHHVGSQRVRIQVQHPGGISDSGGTNDKFIIHNEIRPIIKNVIRPQTSAGIVKRVHFRDTLEFAPPAGHSKGMSQDDFNFINEKQRNRSNIVGNVRNTPHRNVNRNGNTKIRNYKRPTMHMHTIPSKKGVIQHHLNEFVPADMTTSSKRDGEFDILNVRDTERLKLIPSPPKPQAPPQAHAVPMGQKTNSNNSSNQVIVPIVLPSTIPVTPAKRPVLRPITPSQIPVLVGNTNSINKAMDDIHLLSTAYSKSLIENVLVAYEQSSDTKQVSDDRIVKLLHVIKMQQKYIKDLEGMLDGKESTADADILVINHKDDVSEAVNHDNTSPRSYIKSYLDRPSPFSKPADGSKMTSTSTAQSKDKTASDLNLTIHEWLLQNKLSQYENAFHEQNIKSVRQLVYLTTGDGTQNSLFDINTILDKVGCKLAHKFILRRLLSAITV